MHLAAMHALIIIEHQDHILRHIGQIIDEQGGHTINWRELRSLEAAGAGLAGVGEEVLQGGGEYVHDGGQLVVVVVEGEPGAWVVDRLESLWQQYPVCKSGGCETQGDFAAGLVM